MLTLVRPRGAAATCPRCGRQVAPGDLDEVPLTELRLIDPHLDAYVHCAARSHVAVCQACGDQLDSLAGELEAYRRRLLRAWPTPTAYRAPPREDQCLSRPFEVLRDTALPAVLGYAIWYERRDATAYLTVYDNGEWGVDGVPRDRAYAPRDERGHVAAPIPVAPGAAPLADEELVGLSAEALYRRCVATEADARALELELAARFYRALYSQKRGG